MTAPLEIRPLRAEDFDRVLELEQALFGQSAWTQRMLAEELGGWGRWYVVAAQPVEQAVGRLAAGHVAARAAEQSRVVGYAGLWFDGEIAQVMTLGVDPGHQRAGVGRALMEALITRSRALRASAVWLEVAVTNAAALALYEELGFTRQGIRRRYYQPEGLDAHTMRLTLEEA
ncbi:MAG: GNAT family N-acetyltransferase [Promicromonosporaceae bacterium]|nr:GNAT family N-acetyltransferase [Promicromonosporaceae bacterium]